jgi:hypothetical protein
LALQKAPAIPGFLLFPFAVEAVEAARIFLNQLEMSSVNSMNSQTMNSQTSGD